MKNILIFHAQNMLVLAFNIFETIISILMEVIRKHLHFFLQDTSKFLLQIMLKKEFFPKNLIQ